MLTKYKLLKNNLKPLHIPCNDLGERDYFYKNF